MTGLQILDLTMPPNDSGACTVRGYLKVLLMEILREGERFSGKRPFGNSGWEYDLYAPLVKAGVVAGTLNEHGFIDDISRDEMKAADKLIFEAIRAL